MVESLTSDSVAFVLKRLCRERRPIAVGRFSKERNNWRTRGPQCLRKKRTISEIRDNFLSVAPEFRQFPYMCADLRSQTSRGIR